VLQQTLRVLNEMKAEGVVSDYAIAGAIIRTWRYAWCVPSI